MIQIPNTVIMFFVTLVMGVSYPSGDVEETRDTGVLEPIIAQEVQGDSWHADLLGDIEMEDGWDAELPTKPEEGTYTPGELKDGIWNWDFIPSREEVIDKTADTINEKVRNYIDDSMEDVEDGSLDGSTGDVL